VRGERGTVLLELIVLGFAVILVILPVLTTVARVIDANAAVSTVARDSASWVARHGTQWEGGIEGVSVETSVDGGVATATARASVTLIGVAGVQVARDVVATFSAPISPYRSDQ
jgi:predicted nucleic acid-binding protein